MAFDPELLRAGTLGLMLASMIFVGYLLYRS